MNQLAALGGALALLLAACGGGQAGTPSATGGPSATDGRTTPGTAGMPGMKDMAGMPGMGGSALANVNCSSTGTTLTIAAHDTAFDKDCLAATAGRPFTISFDNTDPVPHNIAVVEGAMASDVLFRSEPMPGPRAQTLRVGALKPGVYSFHCEVHPAQMWGTLVVR